MLYREGWDINAVLVTQIHHASKPNAKRMHTYSYKHRYKQIRDCCLFLGILERPRKFQTLWQHLGPRGTYAGPVRRTTPPCPPLSISDESIAQGRCISLGHFLKAPHVIVYGQPVRRSVWFRVCS